MKLISVLLILVSAAFAVNKKKPVAPPASPLDRYVNESRARSLEAPPSLPGDAPPEPDPAAG